ncbi:MAG: bifunctional adenosylcobinamide kinase/adenosylcobinamide-phosphate guanylyltransferase [Hyphomicrobium sp.]
MARETLPRLTFVLGGARSGKSRYGEQLVMGQPAPWTYIATADAYDDEMRTRIAEHRARRDGNWLTRDAPLDLADCLKAHGQPGHAVLVDCLTLWLSNVMLAGRDVDADCRALLAAMEAAPGPVVVVSNEVGLGIVPENALARRFRDCQGRLNADVAARADRVILMAAGLPLVLKSETAAR